jgi:hypothetical protein
MPMNACFLGNADSSQVGKFIVLLPLAFAGLMVVLLWRALLAKSLVEPLRISKWFFLQRVVAPFLMCGFAAVLTKLFLAAVWALAPHLPWFFFAGGGKTMVGTASYVESGNLFSILWVGCVALIWMPLLAVVWLVITMPEQCFREKWLRWIAKWRS